MKKLVDRLIEVHGYISDKDFIWWPFSFLRPERNQEITPKNKILMTFCFGGASSLMLAIVAIMNNAFEVGSFLQTSATLVASFFIWFSIVTVPLWNARARKLNRKQ
ncbi:MAG: hypothetical protein ACOVP4_09290 [Bacteriovoracaceae bacterium]